MFETSSLQAMYYATDQYMHTMYGTELNDHRAASELDTLQMLDNIHNQPVVGLC